MPISHMTKSMLFPLHQNYVQCIISCYLLTTKKHFLFSGTFRTIRIFFELFSPFFFSGRVMVPSAWMSLVSKPSRVMGRTVITYKAEKNSNLHCQNQYRLIFSVESYFLPKHNTINYVLYYTLCNFKIIIYLHSQRVARMFNQSNRVFVCCVHNTFSIDLKE